MVEITNRSLQAALISIQSDLYEADRLGSPTYHGDFPSDDDSDAAEWLLISAWERLIAVLNVLGQSFLQHRAEGFFQTFEASPLNVDTSPDGDPYLKWASVGRRLLNHILEMYPQPDPAQEPVLFSNLLDAIRKSEYSVGDRAVFVWKPCAEDDVHKRIELLLRGSYPLLRTKPSITLPIKTSIPDTGVPEVKTLIEYKFLKENGEAQKLADEILADTVGYQTDGYEQLVFVIYETERFKTEEEWQALIDRSPSPQGKTVIVLRGSSYSAEDEHAKAAYRKAGAKASTHSAAD